MSKENDLKSDFQDIYNDCYSSWNDYLEEALLNMDYFLGAQFTSEDQKNAELHNRTLLVVNKIRRAVRLLVGYEEKNQHILKIAPVGREDDEVSRQLTSCVMQVMNYCNGYDYISDAFKWGNLISASNLLELWRDRDGCLRLNRIGYNGFLLDPNMTKEDLSDCDNIITGRWLSKDKIQMLVPSADLEDVPETANPQRWLQLTNPYNINSRKLRLYEEWWQRDVKHEDYVGSRINGQTMRFDEFTKQYAQGSKNLAKRIIAEYKLNNGVPAFVKYKEPKDVIKLSLFVNNEPIWEGENPLLINDYNFVWMHGEFCPEHSRDELKLQSMVSYMRDPQNARNRRINQAIDIIESTLQAWRVVRDEYLKNPEKVYESGQGAVLHIQDKTPPNLPLGEIFAQVPGVEPGQGLLQLMEILDKDGVDVSGLNDEIFGSDDKDIPAILSKFRTGQALTGQQDDFKSLRMSKKQLGNKMVKAIQANYDPERVKRMINEYPVPEFYKSDLVKYDCMPVEGLLTDNQQSMFYEELKYLRQTFPDMAQLITPIDLIKAAPIQFKKDLLEIIAKRQESQERQMQLQAANQERMNKLVDAQAQVSLAQAMENIEDVKVKRADTALTRAKTAAEINKLRSEPILNLIDKAIALEQKGD